MLLPWHRRKASNGLWRFREKQGCIEVSLSCGTHIATVTVRAVETPEPPAGSGTIRGTKFNDLNANGQGDPGKPGLPNWKIFVSLNFDSNCDTGEPFSITDSDGNYSISELPTGQVLNIREEMQPGWTANIMCYAITLSPGEVQENVDFGNKYEGVPENKGTLEGYKRDAETGAGLENWRIYIDLNGNDQ